jgi:hypothetical protein
MALLAPLAHQAPAWWDARRDSTATLRWTKPACWMMCAAACARAAAHCAFKHCQHNVKGIMTTRTNQLAPTYRLALISVMS